MLFLTLDNGGKPYLIKKSRSNLEVYTYSKRSDWNNPTIKEYTKLVTVLPNPVKVFWGKYRDKSSSALIDMGNGQYIFIGHIIYAFKTPEPITKYYSFIGNSAVPYPVALSKNYAYFMLDKKYAPRNQFPTKIKWENEAYSYFYDHPGRNLTTKKFIGVKQLHKP